MNYAMIISFFNDLFVFINKVPEHKQGTGWEVEEPAHELVPLWDASAYRQRIGQFSHHAGPMPLTVAA